MRGGRWPLPSPVFALPVTIAVLAGTGLLLQPRGPLLAPMFILFTLAGWIVSLCLHEFAHALVANLGGDRGIAERGYLTLNPIRYSHPLLSLLLPLLFLFLGGIGLPGGAVYVDSAALRGRPWQSLVAAAGPLANLLILLVLAIALQLLQPLTHLGNLELGRALAFQAFLQLTAVVLNLLPLPPLDGFGIVSPWLPAPVRSSSTSYGPLVLVALYLVLLRVPAVSGQFWSSISDLAVMVRIPVQLLDGALTLLRSPLPH